MPRRKLPARLRFVFAREVRFPNRAHAEGEWMGRGRDVSRNGREGRQRGFPVDTPSPPCDSGRGIMRKEGLMAKFAAKLAVTAFGVVTPD